MDKKLREKILSRIKPSKEEQKIVNTKTKALVKKLRKIKEASVLIGGSDAKGTVIRKELRDVDIFVAFNYKKYSRCSSKLSDILARELKKLKIKFIRLHGSRDYFYYSPSLTYNNAKIRLKFEIVPILKITKPEQALNVTDVSPLHTKYIKKKILKKKELADDIRLAKSFCYAQGCYGAESYVRGFSGYALEVLVIHYNSFMNFIRHAAKWRKEMYKGKVIIDPKKFYKSKDEVLFALNESKLLSPLILIDPIQKDRNATAALNEENFNQFINACKKFLKKPSERFFVKSVIDEKVLRKLARKGEKLICIGLSLMPGKEDIIGAKLKKIFDFILEEFERNGFVVRKKIFDFSFSKSKAHFYFIIKNPLLSKYVEHRGPPISMKEYANDFLNKWKGRSKKIFEKKGRLYAIVERKFCRAEDLLQYILDKKIDKGVYKKIIKNVRLGFNN